MQLFYPVTLEEGVHILRVKLRPDVIRRDQNGNITCYVSREAAQRKAVERSLSGKAKQQEMFLVAIEVTVPGIVADLKHERPIDRVPLASFKGDNRETVLLSKVAQDMLSKASPFSLEIVPSTEDLYTPTYLQSAGKPGDRIGPWK